MARIKLENIGLTFRVKRRGKSSLKDLLINRLTRQPIDPWIRICALDGLSFELRDGDRVGVIGHNGAGKSTLLRLIAGVYPPTDGFVDIQGKISSLFDVTMGFENDCSLRSGGRSSRIWTLVPIGWNRSTTPTCCG